MVTGKKLYVLANVESELDPATGDRTKKVTRGLKLINNVELISLNTDMVGQQKGFNLSYSVKIYRAFYRGEKYLYSDGILYEIKKLGNADIPTKMLLNIQKLDDADIKAAIEKWIQDEAKK